MKNRFKLLLGVLVLFGFVLVGCSDDSDDGGTKPDPNPDLEFAGYWEGEFIGIEKDSIHIEVKKINNKAMVTKFGVSITDIEGGSLHSTSFSNEFSEGYTEVKDGNVEIIFAGIDSLNITGKFEGETLSGDMYYKGLSHTYQPRTFAIKKSK